MNHALKTDFLQPGCSQGFHSAVGERGVGPVRMQLRFERESAVHTETGNLPEGEIDVQPLIQGRNTDIPSPYCLFAATPNQYFPWVNTFQNESGTQIRAFYTAGLPPWIQAAGRQSPLQLKLAFHRF